MRHLARREVLCGIVGMSALRCTDGALGGPRVVHGESADVRIAVSDCLRALGGLGSFVRSGDSVAVKVNWTSLDPTRCTSGDTLRVVVQALLDAGAGRIVVVEAPPLNVLYAARKLGLGLGVEMMPRTHVRLLQAREDFISIPIPEGVELRRVSVAREVAEADVLVNLTHAKTDPATTVALATKNLLGAVWESKCSHLWSDRDQAIADIASVVRPRLSLVESFGHRDNQRYSAVVAGTSVAEVDAVALSRLPMGNSVFGPRSVRHVELASRLGL